MNSTPEPSENQLEPTRPEELLARAKARSLAIRRHRLLGATGSTAVVLALVLSLVLVPGGSAPLLNSHHRPGQIFVSARVGSAYELTANEAAAPAAPASVTRRVENAEVAFSLDLLTHLAGSSDVNNQLVSPSSLATALAMLELGASGSTEQAIAATLRTAGLSAGDQAAGWHGLAALLAAESSATGTNLAHVPQLDVANAVWLERNLAVQPAFLRSLSSEFMTGLWRVDFIQDLSGATNAINQWTSENTRGYIKQLFTPGALNIYTRLVLADAVFFRGDWVRKFLSATESEPFHLGSGGTVTVPFMISGRANSEHPLTAPVAVTHQYVAVELPYAGKSLSALVVMPTGSSLSSFVSSLTPGSLDRLVKGLLPAAIDLSMPTFTIRSDNQLNQTLSSMGMSDAFSLSADFSRIDPNLPLYVQTVEQHAYLQVTPKGTTAAAATGIGVGTSAVEVPKPVVIDHPFLFLVRDDATGAILFESMVENPAS